MVTPVPTMKANLTPEGHDESFRGLPFILDTSSFPVPLSTPAPVEPVAVAAASVADSVRPVSATSPSGGVERWRPLVQSIFPESEAENALAIMECESHGNPAAVGDSGNSLGAFQLWRGWAWWYGVPEEALMDIETNTRVAAAVLAHRGRWGGAGGWSCATLRGIP